MLESHYLQNNIEISLLYSKELAIVLHRCLSKFSREKIQNVLAYEQQALEKIIEDSI